MRFFALGDTWRRPLPESWLRQDVLAALAFLALAVIGLETARSMALLETTKAPVWGQYLALASTALVIIWRRRFPLTAVVLAAAAMFATGVTMPMVMSLFIPQVLYLLGFYSAMAWGAPRTRALEVTGAMVVFMFGWITWQFIWGDSLKLVPPHPVGLMSPELATIIYSVMLNIVFFGGAVVTGQTAWRDARQQAEVERQAETIEGQSQDLRQQAVLDERLRIARELHDVVAHHVAVMGVQAGAARKTLDRKPEATAGMLLQIESSAREAVSEMRSLLGTLRREDETGRTPEPTSADIAPLIDEVRAGGLAVTYDVVEDRPGLLDEMPPGVGLSLYRAVQEALSNVRRHSTADSASVVLRGLQHDSGCYAEVEVLDDGRPRQGTTGSGLGLVGMRERVSAHNGVGEIGPRANGGYRVRIRLPLGATKS
ncbi:hypothetical protein VV02_25630 [Luteipulveratus mongoliensis]|uniref:histidine kinase n=1 Tax=Luteipulveratus mongoliensis TaxID=571913 RepID=A0A0K1JPD0_9MICO|nr:hypothetical protein VV02_25630 [Luteipulveratus mongoliensis]